MILLKNWTVAFHQMIRRLDSQALHAAAFLLHANQGKPELMRLGIERRTGSLEDSFAVGCF